MPEEMFCWHCVYWLDTHCQVGKGPTACGSYFTPRRPAPLELEYPLEATVTPAPAEAAEAEAEAPAEAPARDDQG